MEKPTAAPAPQPVPPGPAPRYPACDTIMAAFFVFIQAYGRAATDGVPPAVENRSSTLQYAASFFKETTKMIEFIDAKEAINKVALSVPAGAAIKSWQFGDDGECVFYVTLEPLTEKARNQYGDDTIIKYFQNDSMILSKKNRRVKLDEILNTGNRKLSDNNVKEWIATGQYHIIGYVLGDDEDKEKEKNKSTSLIGKIIGGVFIISVLAAVLTHYKRF